MEMFQAVGVRRNVKCSIYIGQMSKNVQLRGSRSPTIRPAGEAA